MRKREETNCHYIYTQNNLDKTSKKRAKNQQPQMRKTTQKTSKKDSNNTLQKRIFINETHTGKGFQKMRKKNLQKNLESCVQ